jgi:hypothetical protein
MNKIKYWYIEALVLAVIWTVASGFGNPSIVMASYSDIISVAVLIVFIQFLFQTTPPAGTANYLRLSYLSLLFVGFALASGAPQVIILFLSGYVFSLSIVYVLRQIQGT